VRASDPLLAQYARNPSHPNPIYSLQNGDIDSLLELVGHIRAENPKATVRWRTFDRLQYADELSGNVVILGGGDGISSSDSGLVGEFTRSLDLPIAASSEPERDVEYGSRFTVRENESGEPDPAGTRQEVYRARFLLDDESSTPRRQLRNGAPVLEYDIAAIARRPNPYNGGASVTLCSGIFSRGTYAAVRAFTDEKLRQRNEEYLYTKLDPKDFWILIQVPVFMSGTRTTTPDIDRAFTRLRTSSPPRS
jgi:hypothetical protein